VSGLPWAQARTRAYAAAAALPAGTVPLAEAVGGTLSAPLVALSALPSFDTAAMDGYAVAGPGPWRVVRRILAGHGDPGALAPGQAAEVATGAPVPRGAGAVLRHEDARPAASPAGPAGGPVPAGDPVPAAVGEVWVAAAVPVVPERHVRRLGEDCPAGAELLPAGTPVTPVVAALAASLGRDTLPVRQPARVVALITGDEVVHRGVPGHGRVRDAIGPLLPGFVARHGAQLTLRMPVPDEPPGGLASAVQAADAEVVLSCGATAAGPCDRLRPVLADLGARPVVDQVACRPGHPQSLWVLPDGRYVVGVPGNPFAALVACHTLLAPLLAGLAGRALPALPTVPLALPQAGPGGAGAPVGGRADSRILPVRWRDGTLAPVGHDGPASLWGAALADGLAVLPPGWAGEPVPLLVPV
jgi:molybdopterin molybdotransferase